MGEIATFEDDVWSDWPLTIPNTRRSARRRYFASRRHWPPTVKVGIKNADLVSVRAHNKRIPCLSGALNLFKIVTVWIVLSRDVTTQITRSEHHETPAVATPIAK